MFTFVISLKQLNIIQRKGVYPNYGNNKICQMLSFGLNVCLLPSSIKYNSTGVELILSLKHP